MSAQVIEIAEGDPAFREPVVVVEPCVEFRRRPILLRHNARSLVVGPNEVMLWNRGDVYERRAIERGQGDVLVRYPFDGPPFTVNCVPCDAELFLRERLGALECGGIAAALKAAAAPPHSKIEHAKFVLSQELRRPVSIRNIAADVGLSMYYLSKVFRDATGYSMTQYRQQLRLRIAFERIATADSLYEIANDLGFADQSHFTRAFRRAFGAAPGAFRRRAANSF